jgi:hypothetical protein
MLIFNLEKEYQPDCQNSIEGSIKESGILNRFTNDGYAGQIALECGNERWCSIYPEYLKSCFDQYDRYGKAGTAAQIDNAAAGR